MTELSRAAPVSFNPATRTFTAIAATSTPVKRCDYHGDFNEVLAVSGNNIRLDRLASGRAPLLDGHAGGSVRNQIGIIRSARVDNGELLVDVELSDREDVAPIAADLAAGIIRNVSVGYRVHAAEESTEAGVRTITATDWEPFEVSLVPVGADPAAHVRSIEEPSLSTTTPATTDLVEADRARAATINELAQRAGLTDLGVEHIVAGTPVADFRILLLDAIVERDADGEIPPRRSAYHDSYDDPAFRIRAAGEAVYARLTPGHEPSEQARPFLGRTLLDLARDSLRIAGIRDLGFNPPTTIERALGTSDFPLILGDALGRTLRAAYAAAPSGLKLVGRKTTARDFRDKHRLQLSEAPRLEKVNEHGEFKHGGLVEAGETYKVVTYGKILSVSRQALVNDDLGAFADLARRMGQAAAATEAELLVDLLLANSGAGPTLHDSVNLFHATHKNLAAGAGNLGAPSVTTLSVGRTAMRKQVGLSGELIDVSPRWIVVPPELETTAEQVLATIAATKSDDINPFSGRLSLAVEPRLTSATAWYLTADPASVDGLEYAHLEGQEGVQIETRAGFDVDGVQIRARIDFGAGFVDHRGWWKNPGA
ncbi:prohead protease/major capsid protein fusion protein [Chelatococcus asaccharovorans]|uniref:HK97 family phage prohead protease n=1 Tax=Chelatococcus asaccharovorans TaxID=28210 RepID=A0A2V3TSH5_9HYPH|nr:prohead protease/major capsid protein fusion protein [Chelatococcus asaccharovorans]MBS7702657.1 Mu-like prophage major head subunit gpT family protein [Chelatococcus asaccharovorans]PXW50192.1 HK97 family phage prohead protease [Chelatococcus asaccharovorans]